MRKNFFLVLALAALFTGCAPQAVIVKSAPPPEIPSDVSPRYSQHYNLFFPVSFFNGLGHTIVLEVGATKNNPQGWEEVSSGQNVAICYERGYEERQVGISGRVLKGGKIIGTLPVMVFWVPARSDPGVSNLAIPIGTYNPLRFE